MKQVTRFAVFVLLLISAPTVMKAQKVAHIDRDSLLRIMPEYKTITDSLSRYSLSVQRTMISMEEEYGRKMGELDSLRKSLSPLMVQLREKQLADMQQNYAAFSQAAEQEMMTIQNNLVTPLFKKVDDAIAAVAKEKGYTYVLDSSEGGMVLYSRPEDDIFNLVCLKLGVTPPAKKVTPAPGGTAPGGTQPK